MPPPLNPYVAGNPVGDSSAFVGRADVLREVLRVLRRPKDTALVLYGQRRIGKTSILEHLASWLPREGSYRPVYFDLQDKAGWTLGRVLESLATSITDSLDRPPPDLGSEPSSAFRKTWLPELLAGLADDSCLVLLFDEFDVLADPKSELAGSAFFPYLRDLLTINPARLQFVFVIGRNVDDLDHIALSLFKGTDARRVSLLSSADTEGLVRLSEAERTLHWQGDTVARVWELTHGHPLLTQQLCSHVWERAYDEEPEDVPAAGVADVDAVLDGVLDASQSSLQWLWDGLPPAERIVISALAEAGPVSITAGELEKLLHESGVRVVIGDLQNAPEQLQDWDILEPDADALRFRVELFRRWVVSNRPLNRAQRELDHIEPAAQNLYRAARGLYRSEKLQDAIAPLRQALSLNPNHLGANQLLADILLSQGRLGEARQLLDKLYEYHPAAARPRLVQVLMSQAQATSEENEKLALYHRITEIDPSHSEALGCVTAIRAQRVERTRKATQRMIAVLRWALAVVLLVTLVAGYYLNIAQKKNQTIQTYVSFLEETLRMPDPVRGFGAGMSASKFLDAALVLADERLANHPDIHADVHLMVGSGYYGLGKYERAKEVLSLALIAQRAGRRNPSKKIAETLGVLARTHWRLGDYERADALINEALDLASRIEGDESVEVATYTQAKADVLYDLGRVEKAGELYRQASEMLRRLVATGKSDTRQLAMALSNYADFMVDRGLLAESRDLLLEARSFLHEADYVTLEVESLLGDIAFEARDYERARERYEWVLETTKERLDVHPDVAIALSDLGWWYLEMGQFARTEDLFNEALRINQEIWPMGGHVEIANSQQRLAWVQAEQGRHEEAEGNLREALLFLEEKLGSRHFKVYPAKELLARVLGDLRRYEESEGYYRQLLDTQEGQDDLVQLTRYQLDLATLFWRQGREAVAIDLSGQALETLIRQDGETSLGLAINREKLGKFSCLVGRFDEAARWYMEAYDTYTNADATDMLRAARVKREIALLHVKQGTAERAQAPLDECRAILDGILPPEHWFYSTIKAVEAARLSRLGKGSEADALFMEALQELASKKGKDARETRTVEELSATYSSN